MKYLIFLGLFFMGCASTKQYQREHLADPIMELVPDQLEKELDGHTHPYREGSMDVDVQGGGCGC